MISNQAPQGQATTAVRPDSGTGPPGGGSLGSRLRGMNVSVLFTTPPSGTVDGTTVKDPVPPA